MALVQAGTARRQSGAGAVVAVVAVVRAGRLVAQNSRTLNVTGGWRGQYLTLRHQLHKDKSNRAGNTTKREEERKGGELHLRDTYQTHFSTQTQTERLGFDKVTRV